MPTIRKSNAQKRVQAIQNLKNKLQQLQQHYNNLYNSDKSRKNLNNMHGNHTKKKRGAPTRSKTRATRTIKKITSLSKPNRIRQRILDNRMKNQLRKKNVHNFSVNNCDGMYKYPYIYICFCCNYVWQVYILLFFILNEFR